MLACVYTKILHTHAHVHTHSQLLAVFNVSPSHPSPFYYRKHKVVSVVVFTDQL